MVLVVMELLNLIMLCFLWLFGDSEQLYIMGNSSTQDAP